MTRSPIELSWTAKKKRKKDLKDKKIMQKQNRKENHAGRQEKRITTMSSKRPKEMPNLKKTTKDNNSNRIKRSKMGRLY